MTGHSQESLLTVDPFVRNLIALLDLPNWFNKDWIHLMAPYRNDLTRGLYANRSYSIPDMMHGLYDCRFCAVIEVIEVMASSQQMILKLFVT